MPFSRCLALPAGLLAVCLFSGCARQLQAFYVSPFNGNNESYSTIPTIDDTARTAVYADLAYSWGSANDYDNDRYAGTRAGIHVAQQFHTIQCYYGVNASLGNYRMGPWQAGFISANVAHADLLNFYSDTYFFGGLGFQGGFNGVVPMGNRGEWRFLGIETSVTKEFGDYLGVRQEMPDSIATLLNPDALFATVGLTTEVIRYTDHGEFGGKWAFGLPLGHRYIDPGVEDLVSRQQLVYIYFDCSFHYTYLRWTAYAQLTRATKALGLYTGVNYRL